MGVDTSRPKMLKALRMTVEASFKAKPDIRGRIKGIEIILLQFDLLDDATFSKKYRDFEAEEIEERSKPHYNPRS